MSALGGNPQAAMGMGYRHLHGIGVPQSCEKARNFYEYSANEAAEQIRERGQPVYSERVMISEMETAAAAVRKEVDFEVIDYYKHLVSAGGDSAAAHTLGTMYFQGSRFVDQDMEKAIKYLGVAADSGSVVASGQLGYLLAQQYVSTLGKEKEKNSTKVEDHTPTTSPNTAPSNNIPSSATQIPQVSLVNGDVEKNLKMQLDIVDRSSKDQTNPSSPSTQPIENNLELKRIEKLLRYSSNRGDVSGQIGLGYLHFVNLLDASEKEGGPSKLHSTAPIVTAADKVKDQDRQMRNIAAAFNIFFKLQAKHADAGFFMGEILMGRGQKSSRPLQSATPTLSQIPIPIYAKKGQLDTLVDVVINNPIENLVEQTEFQRQQDREQLEQVERNIRDQALQGTGHPMPKAKNNDPLVSPPLHPPIHPSVDLPITPATPPLIVKIDPMAAVQAYAASSQRGNLLALHRLSHLAAQGMGMVLSCQTAANGFKSISERGDWSHDLTLAHRLVDAGDRSAALVLFSQHAAVGLENAQFNAAYLLMRFPDLPWLKPPSFLTKTFNTSNSSHTAKGMEEIIIGETGETLDALSNNSNDNTSFQSKIAVYLMDLSNWGPKIASNNTTTSADGSVISSGINTLPNSRKADNEARALILYAVSAAQGNAESFLRLGDCYYYGCAGLSRDKVEAAMFYQLAADMRNTHAIFNLGLMHEAGDGLPQDFHLAKRFYDQAFEVDPDAKLPRAVALFLLRFHIGLQDYLGPEVSTQMEAVAFQVISKFEGFIGMGISKRLQDMILSQLRFHSTEGQGDYQGGNGDQISFKGVQGSLKRAIISIGAKMSSLFFKESEGFGDLIVLGGLVVIFIAILYWRTVHRQARGRVPQQ